VSKCPSFGMGRTVWSISGDVSFISRLRSCLRFFFVFQDWDLPIFFCIIFCFPFYQIAIVIVRITRCCYYCSPCRVCDALWNTECWYCEQVDWLMKSFRVQFSSKCNQSLKTSSSMLLFSLWLFSGIGIEHGIAKIRYEDKYQYQYDYVVELFSSL
jgi:hypothetical protein